MKNTLASTLSLGLPLVIQSDNWKEFCCKAMLKCAHDRGVALCLIEGQAKSERPH